MVRWLFRCGKCGVGAVVGLASLIALAEVGLRIAAITQPSSVVIHAGPTQAAVTSHLTGWELRPLHRTTVHPDEGDPFVFRTNRWGLRGGDITVPKPMGVFRIVCLGDENLVASDCPEPQTFCVQLQAALQNGVNYPIEVVNAGLPLGGPSVALIHFERTVSLLQPDALLVMMDAQDIVEDVRLRKWMTRDKQGQPVSCSPPESPLPKSPNLITRLRSEFRMIDLGWQRLAGELAAKPSEDARHRSKAELPAEHVTRSLAPLQELFARCEARQARMLIVATPARGSVVGNNDEEPTPTLADATFFTAMGGLLKQTGITGIDATAAFDKMTDGTTWSLDEHHQLAMLVAQGIRERLPGPWSSPYFQQGNVTPAGYRTPASGVQR